jgi:hypothetical protein
MLRCDHQDVLISRGSLTMLSEFGSCVRGVAHDGSSFVGDYCRASGQASIR